MARLTHHQLATLLQNNSAYNDEAPFPIHVGEGWFDLIEDLHHALLSLCPGYQVVQIKEKFGSLRFYADITNSYPTPVQTVFYQTINQYEVMSSKICEECGAAGMLREDLSWMRTLCTEHYILRLAQSQNYTTTKVNESFK